DRGIFVITVGQIDIYTHTHTHQQSFVTDPVFFCTLPLWLDTRYGFMNFFSTLTSLFGFLYIYIERELHLSLLSINESLNLLKKLTS
ncbi:hypothetical protein ACJX0J_018645, partial [Zea mays]